MINRKRVYNTLISFKVVRTKTLRWFTGTMLSVIALSMPVLANIHPVAVSDTTALNKLIYNAADSGFSGSVLVARGNTIISHEGVGTIAGTRIGKDDRFWIASTGKQFVAAAIMRLRDEGKLNLNDSLGQLFPGCPPDKKMITILQLLSHTSGFGQSYVSEQLSSRDEAVKKMLTETLQGTPGDKFRYSNLNIQLSAAIIEQVSGMSYADFVTKNLFRVAGMKHTGFAGDKGSRYVTPGNDTIPSRLVKPYWGEQGVYSSAGDLYNWWLALRGGKIISAKALTELFNPVVKIGEGQAALCWFLGRSTAGHPFIFIRGNEDFGANSLIYAYPDRQITIIILTHAGDSGDVSWSRKLQQEIAKLLNL